MPTDAERAALEADVRDGLRRIRELEATGLSHHDATVAYLAEGAEKRARQRAGQEDRRSEGSD